MIRIGILGDIGSGKSYIAKKFGFPVFNADEEVAKLYKKNKKIFTKLKKSLPKYIETFPISKKEISKAILGNKNNLPKIIKIIHSEVRKRMYFFLKKNKGKKIIILDIPLLLENKINKKKDVIIFVDASKTQIYKRLRKRTNFNLELVKKFKKLQLPIEFKKKKSSFIIKNNFKNKSLKKDVKKIREKILNNA